jgi:hypothetical protein
LRRDIASQGRKCLLRNDDRACSPKSKSAPHCDLQGRPTQVGGFIPSAPKREQKTFIIDKKYSAAKIPFLVDIFPSGSKFFDLNVDLTQ